MKQHTPDVFPAYGNPVMLFLKRIKRRRKLSSSFLCKKAEFTKLNPPPKLSQYSATANGLEQLGDQFSDIAVSQKTVTDIDS
jgi:hypothetical protein